MPVPSTWQHPGCVVEGLGPPAGQRVHQSVQQGLEKEDRGEYGVDILDLDLETVQGLQLMRALVTGGAGQVEEFPGRLKYLEQPFECCVKDLRSQVEILMF